VSRSKHPRVRQSLRVLTAGVGLLAVLPSFVVMPALSARSLAVLLQRAGAVRAMELDINKAWVSFMWYSPAAGGSAAGGSAAGGSPTPHKLLEFNRPADRYYAVNNRDFFAVYAR